MIKKPLQTKFLLFTGLFLCLFFANSFAQTNKTEKNGSVASYVRDRDEETGLVRKRTVSAIKPTAVQIIDLEKMTFALINQKRAEEGLEPLTWNDEVARIARLHSDNMVKFKFFSHKGMDGKNVDGRADSIGLTRWTAMGENIAYNRGFQNPVKTAVEKWLLSPSHRENLLNSRWTESAIGIAVTDEGTYFFTQVFLKRK